MTARAAGKSAPVPGADDPHLSRGEQAYRKLRGAIQAGTLKPGTRLREAELATWLGSSRTPVREALGRLQSEGLVVHEPRRGMVIAELDYSMVAELYVMREVLEGTAAALAARHASDVEIAALREIADRDPLLQGNPLRLAHNNRLFHEALYRSAHNRYLLKTLNSLRESMALLGQTTLALNGRAEVAIHEHEAVISAIERHDPQAAEAAARAHIRAAYRSRLRLMFDAEETSRLLPPESGANQEPTA
jgi:DNA-binding GntR family transcriptional regulator